MIGCRVFPSGSASGESRKNRQAMRAGQRIATFCVRGIEAAGWPGKKIAAQGFLPVRA